MNYQEMISAAVATLDAVSAGDPEMAHVKADQVLLALVPNEVQQAYDRLVERCDWWAFA